MTLAILVLGGCLPDLDVVHTWDDGTPTPPPPTLDTGPFDTAEPLPIEGDLVVDATSYQSSVYIELDGVPHLVDETAPWDVRVKRFEIAVNGGVSGDAGVEVAFLPDVSLDDLETPPQTGYATDAEDGPDDDELPDLVFGTWYDYDDSSHVLTPVPGAWIVHTSDAAYVALAIDDYYDDAGTSGVLSLRWKSIDGDPP